MAGQINVAERLAQGRPAVEHTQSYVWACHIVGYQHPDLTMYASQVRDLYDSEDGLNLWVLDDDCKKLRAAANASDEALSRQRALLADLAGAWRGPAADAAAEFLQRHCRAGEAVAAALRVAAERCAALRDEVWQLVDRKVATAIAVDDRRLAERPAWLAAAQTVTNGAGQRSAADELVDQQIRPYVDNDIRTEWLAAMRSTPVSVDAAFDAVTDAVAAAPMVRFELPGDLAPGFPPLDEPVASIAPAIPAAVAPASARAAPPVDPAPAAAEVAAPAAPWDPLTTPPPGSPADALAGVPPVAPLMDAPFGGAAALPTGTGDTGGGLAGSISSVISRIVDGIGGLLGSLTDGLADPSITDDADVDGELAADGPDDHPEKDAEDKGDELADEPDEEAAPAEVDDAAEAAVPKAAPAPEGADERTTEEPSAPPGDAAPPADAPAPSEPSPPPANPEPDKASPCEIAADELPQAGQ